MSRLENDLFKYAYSLNKEIDKKIFYEFLKTSHNSLFGLSPLEFINMTETKEQREEHIKMIKRNIYQSIFGEIMGA